MKLSQLFKRKPNAKQIEQELSALLKNKATVQLNVDRDPKYHAVEIEYDPEVDDQSLIAKIAPKVIEKVLAKHLGVGVKVTDVISHDSRFAWADGTDTIHFGIETQP